MLTSMNQKTIIGIYFCVIFISIILILVIDNTVQKNNYKKLNKMVLLINTKNNKQKKHVENLVVENYQPLTSDTSSIFTKDWNNLAKIISKNYNNKEVFIVLCEPETITYLASALSFILEHINKPVIVSTDNLDDIDDLLKFSTNTKIPEVVIKSDKKVLRGCKAVQFDKNKFSSPNQLNLTNNNCFKISKNKFQPKYLNTKINIIIIKIFPGIQPEYIMNLVNKQKIDGIILELYCDSKIVVSLDIVKIFKDLSEKGIFIVSVSQCNDYENTDIILLKAGVIPAFDMTSPAAFTKLLLVLSYTNDRKVISQLFEKSLRGEISDKYTK